MPRRRHSGIVAVVATLAVGAAVMSVGLGLRWDRGTHDPHILMKLKLRDRGQAVVFAYETGVVLPAAD
jgi:hypothetical protein